MHGWPECDADICGQPNVIYFTRYEYEKLSLCIRSITAVFITILHHICLHIQPNILHWFDSRWDSIEQMRNVRLIRFVVMNRVPQLLWYSIDAWPWMHPFSSIHTHKFTHKSTLEFTAFTTQWWLHRSNTHWNRNWWVEIKRKTK